MDVWLASPEITPRWDWLSAEERARAERFVVPHAREEFAAARSLARGELGKRAGVEPATLRFSFGEHGRPALDPPRDFDFNLSHTRGLVACAIGNGLFGVDVENSTRPTNYAAVARTVFTENEQAQLAAHSQPRRFFFELWTIKEAYIKARGLGFSLPPRQFEVALAPVARLRFIGFSDPQTWCVGLLWPTADHVCAIVANSRRRCAVHYEGRDFEVTVQ